MARKISNPRMKKPNIKAEDVSPRKAMAMGLTPAKGKK